MWTPFKKIQRKRQLIHYQLTDYLAVQLNKTGNRIATKLQAWTAHWSSRQKKLMTLLVLGSWAISSGFILLGAFTTSHSTVLQLPRASIPLVAPVPNHRRQLMELQQIDYYLDSLKYYSPDSYDSFCQRYPGVIDSLKFLQEHFQQP